MVRGSGVPEQGIRVKNAGYYCGPLPLRPAVGPVIGRAAVMPRTTERRTTISLASARSARGQHGRKAGR